ncbi:MAG: LytTR family transcriptional regulator DNA-binding domain-containing protein [Ekhidna sp.]
MTFTNSFKYHLLVGLGISIWLVLFLVLIAPFDVSDLSILIRIRITIVYGVILFFCYFVCIVVQRILFKTFLKWSLILEISIYFLLYFLVLPLAVLYYKSGIVNGDYSVVSFIREQYIPIIIIITPIMYLFRRLAARSENRLPKEGFVLIKGVNRNDVLRVKQDLIIAIKSSDNYVEVNYLESAQLKKKLLRTTLRKVESEFDFLIRAHRSYLINPIHFVEWIDKDIIKLNHLEVPVSKQYRSLIEDLIQP